MIYTLLKIMLFQALAISKGHIHVKEYSGNSLTEKLLKYDCIRYSQQVTGQVSNLQCDEDKRMMYTYIITFMMTSSNGNIFRVTGYLCGEFTGPRWIPHTKACDAELWCFLWSASE